MKLRAAGLDLLVESGAGDRAWLTDDSYAEAGATVVSRSEALAADVVLMVGKPDDALIAALRPGQAIIGLLGPLADPDLAGRLAAAGVTAVSLDMIPRTLPRAQPMDALSSQANIAGYKASVLGAAEFGRQHAPTVVHGGDHVRQDGAGQVVHCSVSVHGGAV